MWQSRKMIIVGHVTEQSVGSYAIRMHINILMYFMHVYVSLIPRPLLVFHFVHG